MNRLRDHRMRTGRPHFSALVADLEKGHVPCVISVKDLAVPLRRFRLYRG